MVFHSKNSGLFRIMTCLFYLNKYLNIYIKYKMKLIFITTLKPMSEKLPNFITEQHNAIQSWLKLNIDKK